MSKTLLHYTCCLILLTTCFGFGDGQSKRTHVHKQDHKLKVFQGEDEQKQASEDVGDIAQEANFVRNDDVEVDDDSEEFLEGREPSKESNLLENYQEHYLGLPIAVSNLHRRRLSENDKSKYPDYHVQKSRKGIPDKASIKKSRQHKAIIQENLRFQTGPYIKNENSYDYEYHDQLFSTEKTISNSKTYTKNYRFNIENEKVYDDSLINLEEEIASERRNSNSAERKSKIHGDYHHDNRHRISIEDETFFNHTKKLNFSKKSDFLKSNTSKHRNDSKHKHNRKRKEKLKDNKENRDQTHDKHHYDGSALKDRNYEHHNNEKGTFPYHNTKITEHKGQQKHNYRYDPITAKIKDNVKKSDEHAFEKSYNYFYNIDQSSKSRHDGQLNPNYENGLNDKRHNTEIHDNINKSKKDKDKNHDNHYDRRLFTGNEGNNKNYDENIVFTELVEENNSTLQSTTQSKLTARSQIGTSSNYKMPPNIATTGKSTIMQTTKPLKTTELKINLKSTVSITPFDFGPKNTSSIETIKTDLLPITNEDPFFKTVTSTSLINYPFKVTTAVKRKTTAATKNVGRSGTSKVSFSFRKPKTMTESNWPSFNNLLELLGKKYDWKNDRWIKIKQKSVRVKNLTQYHNESRISLDEKHKFSYTIVKLNSTKSRRNAVIAVTAVR